MLRVLRYLLLAVIAFALMLFASANRDLVTVRLLPDSFAQLFRVDWNIELPLFVLVFFGLLLGLLVGYTLEWLREHKYRRTASTKTRVVTKLERELAALKDQTSLPSDDVLALLDKPRAR